MPEHRPGHPLRRERRQLLGLALAGAWGIVTPAVAVAAVEAPTGWVSPRLPAPAVRVVASDGRKRPFGEVVAGKVTALQLMFTGCSTTCPAQGAQFAALAGRVQADDVQLLSISIDALGDTPARVSAWQARFGAAPAWRTAVADLADVDRLAAFVRGFPARPGTHTSQVFVFDRQGRLAYRTGDSPRVAELVALLEHVARNA